MSRTKIDLAIIFVLVFICLIFALIARLYVSDPVAQESEVDIVRKDLQARNPNQNLFLPNEMADWERLIKMPIKKQETGTIRVPVLLYHHIELSPRMNSYYVSPQTFERQMKWLYNNKYEVIPLATLTKYLRTGQNPPSEKSVVITFDDGTIGQYKSAFPILHAYNYPATFYIVKQWTDEGQSGQKGGYFGWDEAKTMLAAGMEIGSHSMDHSDLASLSDGESKYEIFQSKLEIEKELNSKISSYAYAGGSMTSRDWALVESAGYDSGLSVNKVIDHKLSEIYHLDRMHIDNDLPYFIARIEGRYGK